MDRLAQLEEQLVELQSQVAFQEDAISELNGALARQQQDLVQLQHQWELLKAQYAELQGRLPQEGGAGSVLDEKPPHY